MVQILAITYWLKILNTERSLFDLTDLANVTTEELIHIIRNKIGRSEKQQSKCSVVYNLKHCYSY